MQKFYVNKYTGVYLGSTVGFEMEDDGALEVSNAPEHGAQLYDLVNNIWLERPLTQEELKLQGVEFEGVMCSATKEDMWGLSAVESWIASGNSVNFEFDNGNKLTLTSDNYQAFQSVWIPFRAGFF